MVYCLAGVASDFLAVPPTFASAFWLPSGIGLIGALYFGWRGILGVFLGAASANSLHLINTYGLVALVEQPATPLLISLGAAIEAWLAATVLRGINAWPEPPQGWKLIGAAVLTGPLACISSALIGSTALLTAGTIPATQWLHTATVWWIGDSVGILLLLPLCYAPEWKDKPAVRRFTSQLAIPLILLFSLSLVLFSVVANWDAQRLQQQVDTAAQELRVSLEESVNQATSSVSALRAFFLASEHVSRDEFKVYAKGLSAPIRPKILMWADWTDSPEELESLKSTLLAEGGEELQLRDVGVSGHDGRRPRVPVTLIEPEAPNLPLRGLDLWSNDGRWPIFQLARDSGQVTMSAPITQPMLPQQQPSVAFVAAVRLDQDAPASKQQGFVIGIFPIDILVGSARLTKNDATIAWTLDDVEQPFGEEPFFTSPRPDIVAATGLEPVELIMDFGFRQWRLSVEALPRLLLEEESLNLWAMQIGSAVLAGLWGLFLLLQWGHNHQLRQTLGSLEDRVQNRTSDLQAASARIAQADQQLRDITNTVPGVVFQVVRIGDEKPEIGFVSAGLARLLDRQVDSALDLDDLIALVAEPDRRELLASLQDQQILTTGEWQQEFRITLPDGSHRWISGKAYRVTKQKNNRTWNGFLIDVTNSKYIEDELRDAKQEADRANKAKSEFLAMMTHEIRTPMTSALGLMDLLQLSDLNFDQAEMLESAHDATRSLLRLIDDLLDLSRIEAGKMELNEEPSSVDDVLTRISRLYRQNASALGLSFVLEIDGDMGIAHYIDRLRLRQILNNMLSNALKFTPRGEVRLVAAVLDSSKDSQTVMFSVHDSGIGISQEQMTHLFEPFSQATRETVEQFGGSGLGLSISRRIAELMNGRFWLESQLGQGTTAHFQVTFRRATRNELIHAQKGSTSTRLDKLKADIAANRQLLSHMKVMAVDDSGSAQRLLNRQFAMFGIEAVIESNGEAAFAHWQQLRPDYLLTDLHMPQMNGYDLAARIREFEAAEQGSSRTYIVNYTAELNAKRHAADSIFDQSLIKPLDLRMLFQSLMGASGQRLEQIEPQFATRRFGKTTVREAALENIAALADGDQQIAADLLEGIIPNLQEDNDLLGKALREEDMKTAASYAHRIRGTLRTISHTQLMELYAKIEHYCRDGDNQRTGQLYSRASPELRALVAELDS